MDSAEAEPRDCRYGVAAVTGMLDGFVPRSPRMSTPSVPVCAFPFQSAFPGPGVVRRLERIYDAVEAAPDTQFVVCGHTYHRGSVACSIHLGDRRAMAALALPTRGRTPFDQIAARVAWSLRACHAMLGRLDCHRDLVDGRVGAMTSAVATCSQMEP